MAGDWIKMNKSLPRDPRVIRISSALKADRLRTVGGLFSAWCIFDEQTEDGILPGYTPEILDELVTFPGLARAMESVGWLEVREDGLAVPRFDEHNGASAKRRAQDRDRKASIREADKCPPVERTDSGPEKRTTEKRRGGGNQPTLDLSDTMPTDNARQFDQWQKKINQVFPDWGKRPSFTQPELISLQTNAKFIGDLTTRDWNLLRAFMRAEIPNGWKSDDRLWQPDRRGQFIANIADVCTHADKWERRCRKEGYALDIDPAKPSAA